MRPNDERAGSYYELMKPVIEQNKKPKKKD